MMVERWKDIDGYEGFYQVSTFGNVRSIARTIRCDSSRWGVGRNITIKSRNLLLATKDNGYLIATLSIHGKHRSHYVHRLVANAFIENPENKGEVNHMDGNKKNNRQDNLEWNTRLQNTTHAYETGLNSGPPPPIKRSVAKIALDGSVVKVYPSIKEAAQEHGGKCYASRICECCLGKRKTFRKHRWEHVKETK